MAKATPKPDNQQVVLVVDDDRQILRLVEKTIANLLPDVTAVTALNANAAFMELSRRRVDAILIDYIMPETNGIDLCRQISGSPETSHIPIALMTGYEISDTIRIQGLEAGAIEFLFKPITLSELIARIKVMLRLKSYHDEKVKLNSILEKRFKEKSDELVSSESRYWEIFQHMSDGVAVYEAIEDGQDFVFKDLNSSGQRISHVSHEEIVGKSVQEVFPSIHEMGLFEVFQRVWKTGTPEHHPTGKYQDDRISIWVDNYVFKLPDGEVVAVYKNLTETKEAELALRESNRRLTTAVSAGKVGLWEWDLRTNKVVYSAEWKRQIGYSEDEIGDNFEEWQSRVHPDDLQATRDSVQRSIENLDKAHKTEFRFRYRDGSYKWILAQASVLTDESGEPLKMIGSHLDITESKLAEQAVRESEEKYRMIAENSSEVIFQLDLDGKIVFASPVVKTFFGYEQEEVLGRHFGHFISENDKADAERSFRLSLSGAEFQLNEHIGVRADGTRFDLEVSTTPIYRDGKIILIQGIIRDITDRKLAEEALRAKSQMLARTEAIANVGSWEWEIEKDKVTWSEELFRIFGIASDKGAPSFAEHPEIYTPEDMERLKAAVEACVNDGAPYEIEIRVIRTVGEIRHCIARGQAMRNAEGKVERLAGSLQDITERKLAELALQRNETFLVTLLDTIPVPVFYKDRDRKYLGVNKAFESFFGTAREDLIGRTVFEIAPKKQADIYDEKDRELLESGGAQRYESQVINFHGEEKTVIFDKAVFKDRSGGTAGLIGTILDITDRKRAEDELRSNKESMEWLLKSMLNCFVIFDSVFDDDGNFVSYRFVYINDAYEKVTGVRQEDVAGRTVHDVWPETEPEWIRRYGEVATTGVPQMFDLFHGPTGKTYHCKVYRPWDTPARFCVIFEDITERKKYEDQLRKNKMLLDAAGSIARLGGWELDAETLDVTWTEETYRIHEVPLDHKPPLQEAIDFYHPSDRKKLQEAIQRALESGEPFDLELRFITAKGRHLWTRSICEPQVDNGRTVKLVGVFQDITERKIADQFLEEQQRILDRTGNMAKVGGWEHDMATGEARWTRSLYDIIGFSPDDPIPGVNEHLDFYLPEDRKVLEAAYDRAVSHGVPFDLELRLNIRKGEDFWAHVYGEPVMEDGRCVKMRGTFQDITERKKAQINLYRISQELRDLSTHLQTAREEERKMIAREIHDELGQALTALKIDVSLLEESIEKSPETAEQFSSVQNCTDILIDLVNRISSDLRPAVLDDFGLISAIEWQVEEFKRKTGIDCTAKLPKKEIKIDQNMASNIYRIVQESFDQHHAPCQSVTCCGFI